MCGIPARLVWTFFRQHMVLAENLHTWVCSLHPINRVGYHASSSWQSSLYPVCFKMAGRLLYWLDRAFCTLWKPASNTKMCSWKSPFTNAQRLSKSSTAEFPKDCRHVPWFQPSLDRASICDSCQQLHKSPRQPCFPQRSWSATAAGKEPSLPQPCWGNNKLSVSPQFKTYTYKASACTNWRKP